MTTDLDGLLGRLPTDVLGVFTIPPFSYAVQAVDDEHAVLALVTVGARLHPLADLVHDRGHLAGFCTRPTWRCTPRHQKNRWRRESAAILAKAADDGRL